MSSRAIRAGKAFVELFADDSRLVRGLRGAQRRLKRWGAQVRAFGAKLAGFSAVALTPVAAATKIFAAFGDQMAKVKAITGASGADFAQLNDKAKELGRTTSFTASQVAGAMVELGRAGFKPTQIDKAIAGVLGLARATDTELPRAAEIAGNALRGFNLDAAQSGKVADVLTATANNSAQGLEDIGEALKVVAPIAVEAGDSLEDTAAAIGVLANNGIKGSLAGNSLARAYKNLSTGQTQAELSKIGVTAVDASGNLRPLAAIIQDVGKATSGFPSAKKLEIFETLFGRGQAAALKLSSATADFKDLQNAIQNSNGVAEKTAKIMDDTLGGAFRKLMSAVEGIAIAVGEAISGSLGNLVERFTAWAGAVTNLIANNREFFAGLIKGIAIAGALGVAIVALGAIFAATGAIIGGVAALFATLATVIGALLSPIGLVVGAVVGLGATILTQTKAGGKATSWLGEKFGALKDTAMASWQGIKDAIAAGDLELAFRIVTLTLKLLWKQAVGALKKGWISFKEIFVKMTATALKAVMNLFGISVKDVVSAFVAVEKAWVHTTSFLKDAWTTFIAGFKKTWNKASGFFKKVWNKIKSVFKKGIDADKLNAQIDRQTAAENARIDRERNSQLSDRDAEKRKRLEEIEAGRSDTEKALNDFFDDDKRAEKFRKQREAVDKDIADAKQELAKAIDEAANKRKKSNAESGTAANKAGLSDILTGGAAGAIGGLLGLPAVAEKLKNATGNGRSSAVGSFAAFGISRFGAAGRSPAQQRNMLLKQIEKNTRRTHEKIEVPRL